MHTTTTTITTTMASSYPSVFPDVSTKYLFDVKDKVILVTGGSSGLGAMMAAAFVQNGAKGLSFLLFLISFSRGC